MKFEHCESMFNSASIGIVMINELGEIELVNKKGCEMFGYEPEELHRQKVEIILPDALRKVHEEHRNNYFKKPTTRTMGSNLNLFAKTKSDDIFPVEISLGHYKVENDRKAIAFITDISVRKAKEQELNRLKLELEDQVIDRTEKLANALAKETEINNMKSRFVSMASHEFRTPLTSVLSSANLATKYIELGQYDKIQKHLDRIEESSNNLVGILNDFLSLEKIDSGKEVTESESFNIDQHMKENFNELSVNLKPGQEFNFTLTGNEEVNTDPRILKNIMFNLLSNSSKYSGPHTAIDVRCKCSQELLYIEIQDYGMGIPLDEQQNLFTKFFRAKNVENIQGTGLGLTIVQRYLELINGSIDFESTEGVGTTFKIEIRL